MIEAYFILILWFTGDLLVFKTLLGLVFSVAQMMTEKDEEEFDEESDDELWAWEEQTTGWDQNRNKMLSKNLAVFSRK